MKHMAKSRGRPAGFTMSAEHRNKIAKSHVLKRLIDFAEGKKGVDMTPHQVSAGIALLRKVMPDLATTTIEGGDNPIAVTLIERNIVKADN